jgi:predicted AAA+ superfamily ATPase
MTQIKDALRDFNPRWYGETVLEFKDREICSSIRKFISLRQIIAITGLRRVGKTTLMHKIADDYIRNGSDPRNVIYFSFDEFRETEIRKVLTAYEEMMEKNIRDGRYLLLLDEVQKLNGWEDQLKVVYDTFNNIKIIISGSESLFIRRGSKETLAGRMFEFKLEPLSFREFLIFKGVSLKPAGIYEKELRKLFDEFILTSGFPEMVNIREKDVIKKYVHEGIVEKVIYRDMPKLLKIKDAAVIESLLKIFMNDPGQIIELSDLARELRISRQTLSSYLGYLESSFLLRKLYNFSKNSRKVERKLKKYYPTIISIDLLFKDDDFSRSKVFEWIVVNQLKAEYFWRDPYKNEVDIVIADDALHPIEIKYGKIETAGLLAFMKKFGVEDGIIISSEKEQTQKTEGRRIEIVPAFKFLLKRKMR